MMEALAELYWEQGKFVESSRVYKKIIAENMDSAAHLRVAEQGGPQHPVAPGTKRDQVQEIERLGAVYDKVGEMKNAKKDQAEECRNVLPRHLAGAGADLAQGGAEDQEPGHLRARQVRLQGVPRALPDDKDAYDMGFYYGELLWTLRALEGRGRAVHQGRRDEAGRQVHERGGLRRRAGLEERASTTTSRGGRSWIAGASA